MTFPEPSLSIMLGRFLSCYTEIMSNNPEGIRYFRDSVTRMVNFRGYLITFSGAEFCNSFSFHTNFSNLIARRDPGTHWSHVSQNFGDDN